MSSVIQIIIPGPMGGLEKVLLSGVKALNELGFKSSIWVIKENRTPEHAEVFIKQARNHNIEIREFKCFGRFDFKLKKELKEELKKTSPKIIHAHGAKAMLYAHLCRPKKSKFITTHHGNTGHTKIVKIYEFIEKSMMKKSDKIIAVSQKMYRDLQDQGFDKNKLIPIENLLSFEVMKREIPQNKKLEFIFIGRLSLEKGCHLLLKALSKVKIEFRLNIIGDGEQKEALIRLTKELNLEKNVFFKGFQKDVRPHLINADALVMPSLREGLPMTLIEACCSGVAVLGSNVGGIPDLIGPKNGILMQPHNVESIKESIIEFHSKKELIIKSAHEQAGHFTEKYHPHQWAKQVIDLYQSY